MMLSFVVLWVVLLCACRGVHAQGDGSNSTDFHLNTLEIPIEVSEYSWFSAILRKNHGDTMSPLFLCGGAFIGSRFVLTARHCILDYKPQEELVVEVGYLCPFKLNCGRPSHQSDVDKIFIDYNGGDLALLVLKDPVPTSLGIRRVIPYLGDYFHPEQTDLKRGDNLTIVGGGTDESGSVSDRVEKLTVKYVSFDECREELGSGQELVDERDFCSRAVVGTACKGDSGSALIIPGEGKYSGEDLMVAVHKFGPRNCADPGKQLFGHFRVRAAAELLRDVACQGDEHEDWCLYPLFAKPGDFPWFTEIVPAGMASVYFSPCSGFLIGSRYVVTSSGCLDTFDDVDLVAHVGHYCRYEDDNCGQPHEMIPFSTIDRHETEDFALLVLIRAVSIDVQPAVPYLGPTTHPKQRELETGQKLKMVAAGDFLRRWKNSYYVQRSSSLKALETAYIKRKRCRKQLDNPKLPKSSDFCTIPVDTYPSFRDQGGALVVRGKGKLKGRDLVMGIQTWTPTIFSSSISGPVVHFEVSKASELIRSVVCEGYWPEEWCQI